MPQGYIERKFQACGTHTKRWYKVAAKTRNSRSARRQADGKLRRKIGRRGDAKPFYFPKSVTEIEVEERTANIKKVYDTCGGWTELSLFIAKHIKDGTTPTPIPPTDRDFAMFFKSGGRPMPNDWRDYLVHTFPFVPWATISEMDLHPKILESMEDGAGRSLQESASLLSQFRPDISKQVQAIPGHLHEALRAYLAEVLDDQPNNHDRHGKIKQLLVRHQDQPLATLGLDSCRVMLNYWRNRPLRHDKKGKYSVKRSSEQRRELDLFFNWLHLSTEFLWRRPEDFDLLERSIKPVEEKQKSIVDDKKPVFSIQELETLVRHAGMPEKLWIVWCLNNSHGAAEVGRVQWEDIFLDQDHPWKKSGLQIWEGGHWTGFRRPKTDVLGWWMLWPETVELLLEWKNHCRKIFDREIKPKDTLIIRESGNPLYGTSKNGQQAFANQFNRLKKQCKKTGHPVTDLPPGTLRDQFADWCGGNEAEATIASVALAHGIPHKGDKLLYKHYSNRPWRRLFEKQEEYREVLPIGSRCNSRRNTAPPKTRRIYQAVA